MLQLPQTGRGRFPTHVGKVANLKVAAAAKLTLDPILSLIEKADGALERYVIAVNAFDDAKETLGCEDSRWPGCAPIPEMRGVWGFGDWFNTETHIDKRFAVARRLTLQALEHSRKQLKQNPGLRREIEDRISADRRLLAALPKWREPMKKAFRREVRRLAKVQRTVDLVGKRHARFKAVRELAKITHRMRAAKPRTVQGALAVMAYVERRCRKDLIELFADEGSFPTALDALLRRARTLLARKIST